MTTDKRNKGLIFLVALFFAIVFWMFTLANSNPTRIQDVKNVAVETRGTELLTQRGLMIRGKSKETVTIRMEGMASALNNVSADWLDAYIDVSKITTPGNYPITVQVMNMANSSAAVHSVSSAEVTVEVAALLVQEVPVEVKFEGTPPEDYWIGEVSWEPQRIQLTGARQDIVAISKATCHVNVETVIAAYEQNGKKGTYSANMTVVYEDENGNAVSFDHQQSVTVTMKIARKKKVPIDFTNGYTGSPGRGYRVGSVGGNVSTVEIIGTQEVLEGIATIGVAPITLNNERSQVVKPTTLVSPAEGVSVLGEGSVVVTIEILPEGVR